MNINNLLGSSPTGSVSDIIDRSSKATCGVFEREVVVKSQNVPSIKAKLRKAGFNIVGTSEPIGLSRKIWFIRSGANL